MAQQVGIEHFYAVTEIKGLSSHLWWMHDSRNLLTSIHVGYRVCHVGNRVTSLKFGIQGVTVTNWYQWVNGAWDNKSWLYIEAIKAYCVHFPYSNPSGQDFDR